MYVTHSQQIYSYWIQAINLLAYLDLLSFSRQRLEQEAQLMLTNLRDAFGGQSRSPNIVPFHILGIVSYCAIVTLSLRYSTSKNVVTLKWGSKVTQDH